MAEARTARHSAPVVAALVVILGFAVAHGPLAAQAPTPQLVVWDGIPSSVWPSQSLSRPSQVSAESVPGVHESTTDPATQEVVPSAAHAPTPHVVATDA